MHATPRHATPCSHSCSKYLVPNHANPSNHRASNPSMDALVQPSTVHGMPYHRVHACIRSCGCVFDRSLQFSSLYVQFISVQFMTWQSSANHELSHCMPFRCDAPASDPVSTCLPMHFKPAQSSSVQCMPAPGSMHQCLPCMHRLACHAMHWHAITVHVVPAHGSSGHVMQCHTMACHTMPAHSAHSCMHVRVHTLVHAV